MIEILKRSLEAFERIARLGNGDKYGNSEGNDIAREQIEPIRNLIAQIEKAEPFGYWFEGERRFATLEEGERYFDAGERKELLIPLYLYPSISIIHDFKADYLEAVRLHNLTLDELREAQKSDRLCPICDQAAQEAIDKPVDLNTCPNCGGPADNGHDREVPPNPFWCKRCHMEAFIPASPPPKPDFLNEAQAQDILHAEPLDNQTAKVLHENAWDLYERTEPAAQEQKVEPPSGGQSKRSFTAIEADTPAAVGPVKIMGHYTGDGQITSASFGIPPDAFKAVYKSGEVHNFVIDGYTATPNELGTFVDGKWVPNGAAGLEPVAVVCLEDINQIAWLVPSNGVGHEAFLYSHDQVQKLQEEVTRLRYELKYERMNTETWKQDAEAKLEDLVTVIKERDIHLGGQQDYR